MADGKVALVLTGGGAKGAFQYAAEKYAREVKGYRWDVIAGVSVGALNGTMLAMEKYAQLEEIWTKTLQMDPIYTGDLGTGAILRFAAKQLLAILRLPPFLGDSRALLGNQPLRRLIQQQFERGRVARDLRIGVVSLKSGAYHVYKLEHGQYQERHDRAGHTGEYVVSTEVDDAAFKQIILASTAIPVIWPPEAVLTVPGLESVVDGGVRNVNPIGDVLDALGSPQDEVVVISCDPKEPSPAGAPRTGVEIAKRSLDLVVAEIIRTDIREFERINLLVKQAEGKVTLVNESGRPLVSYKSTIIRPEAPLDDALDFSPEAVGRSIAKGREMAQKVLGGPAGLTPGTAP